MAGHRISIYVSVFFISCDNLIVSAVVDLPIFPILYLFDARGLQDSEQPFAEGMDHARQILLNILKDKIQGYILYKILRHGGDGFAARKKLRLREFGNAQYILMIIYQVYFKLIRKSVALPSSSLIKRKKIRLSHSNR